jgi:hypothetical protein
MTPKFPIFVRTKDGGSVHQFDSVLQMQVKFERIDVENDEFEGWDVEGHPISFRVQEPIWINVDASLDRVPISEIKLKFAESAELLGCQMSSERMQELNLEEAFSAMRKAMEECWRKKNLFERLKSRF